MEGSNGHRGTCEFFTFLPDSGERRIKAARGRIFIIDTSAPSSKERLAVSAFMIESAPCIALVRIKDEQWIEKMGGSHIEHYIGASNEEGACHLNLIPAYSYTLMRAAFESEAVA